MLTEDVFSFLEDLKSHNDRDWFQENRARYENARQKIVAFTTELKNQFEDKQIDIAPLEPKNYLFRIYRDVRFSKNKEPYKSHFGISFPYVGQSKKSGGYYVHIGAEECFYAGGFWQPNAEELKKIRQEIDYNSEEFLSIVLAQDFVEEFGDLEQKNKLIRPPKGYDETSSCIEWIKLKNFVVLNKIDRANFYKESIFAVIIDGLKKVQKLNDFLFNAIKE